MNNLEKEVDRLKRQSETLKLRRSLAESESKIQKGRMTAKETANLQKELVKDKGQLIYAAEDRIQAIKSRPDTLACDNMSYEDLEELKVYIQFIIKLEST